VKLPKFKKFKKLSPDGFAHHFLFVFVVIFAIAGIGYLVVSHAATTYSSNNEWGKFTYGVGTGTTAPLSHANASNLLLQFDKGITTYHASDTAWYQFTLPANTTASSLNANVSYRDGGYDTVFIATGSPSNRIWSSSKAATVTSQNISLSLANKPTTVYFGISATGANGGFKGSFPSARNFTVNSYTLSGTTVTTVPTVSLTASPTAITASGSSTLTWSSTDATSCSASGGWTGSKATSGSASTGALNTSTTYTLTCTGSGGSNTASATVNVATGGVGGGPGNGTLIFDGTFDSSLSKWPDILGSCYQVLAPDQLQQTLTSSCNPASNGHYRTDLCTSHWCDHNQSSGDYYVAGQVTCTSVPVRFSSLPLVSNSSWLQFAEAKDYESTTTAGWEFDVSSYWGGVNRVKVSLHGYATGTNLGGTAYYDSAPLDTNWHTWSICTNNANDTSGKILGLWKDGVQQTFNYGAQSGSKTLSGFPIITDGANSWPLDINDYTGGSPVPNTIIHGDPLIATLGSSGLPPEPVGGWNSP